MKVITMNTHNGGWFRMYTDFYRNPKLRKLDTETQLLFVWLCCLHKEAKVRDKSLAAIAWMLHYEGNISRFTEMLKSLIDAELLLNDYTPIGWDERQYKSDSSTERVRKHRAIKGCNVSVTAQTRPESDQSRPEQTKSTGWGHLSEGQKKRMKVEKNTKVMERLGSWFGRRPTTLWTIAELESWLDLNLNGTEDEVALMEQYYTAEIKGRDIRRTALSTLLHNWNTELDRARRFKANPKDNQI